MPRPKKDNPNLSSPQSQGSNSPSEERQPIEPQRQHPRLKQRLSINSQNFVMRKVGSFDKEYKIVGKIGEGTFGTVYKVVHKSLGFERALKTIKKRGKKHFSSYQEIQVLKKLDHANILKIYEFFEAKDRYYIITDIFEGRQLFDQIAENEQLTEQQAADVMREILRALNYTHSLKIAHRDIKPENILVQKKEGKYRIKIIDWGLGTLMGDGKSNRVCGTPEYCAPEVLKGEYTLSCDLWSVGGIAYVMLTGEMPFNGSNTEETIEAVKKGILDITSDYFRSLSPVAQQFIVGLMNRDPKQRLTAQQALEHPWIQIYCSQQTQPVELKTTLERLRSFKLGSSLGTAVISFINNHLSAVNERQSLEEIFKHLDANSDGVLSMEELATGYGQIYGEEMGRQIAEQTFAKLDINHNNSLQFSEFVTFGLQQKRDELEQKLKEAFKMFDQDGNGRISKEELAVVLQGRMDADLSHEMMEVVKEIDVDGDGQIDAEEFMKCLNILQKRKSSEMVQEKPEQPRPPATPKKESPPTPKKSAPVSPRPQSSSTRKTRRDNK